MVGHLELVWARGLECAEVAGRLAHPDPAPSHAVKTEELKQWNLLARLIPESGSSSPTKGK